MADKNKRIMRYIVPFSFSEMAYEQLCCRLEADYSWQSVEAKQNDGDIYQYIYHALEGRGESAAAGSAWMYGSKQKGKNKIWDLALRTDKDEWIYGEIAAAGLYIFRTGIGLFWYEIRLERTDLTVDDLIGCQNKLKELNRRAKDGRIFRVRKNCSRLIEKEELRLEKEGRTAEEWQTVDGGRIEPGKIYYVRRSCLSEDIGEGIEYRLAVRDEEGKVRIKYHHLRQVSLGCWVTEMLRVLDCELQYYPGYKNKMEAGGDGLGQPEELVPEEALLFSYFTFQPEDGVGSGEELLDAAWHLNNGFNKRFLMPEGVERQMYQPFRDAYWYAASEGCGCYVRVNSENSEFLQGKLPHRMRNDYFTLYMILLYQAYSLLHFSEKIEYELSADAGTYLEASEAYSRKLQLIQTEINTFLMKSVHTSVSHVQYQNDVYNYIAKRIRIKENVESLTAGVDFLEELQETREEQKRMQQEKKTAEKRQRELEKQEQKEKEEARKRQQEDDRLSIGVSILSLLTVISAFADGIGFLDSVRDDGGILAALGQGLEYIVILAVILIMFITAAVIMGCSVHRFWKNRRNEQPDNESETVKGR